MYLAGYAGQRVSVRISVWLNCGLYYKHVAIVIYNCNDSGLNCKMFVYSIPYDPS